MKYFFYAAIILAVVAFGLFIAGKVGEIGSGSGGGQKLLQLVPLLSSPGSRLFSSFQASCSSVESRKHRRVDAVDLYSHHRC